MLYLIGMREEICLPERRKIVELGKDKITPLHYTLCFENVAQFRYLGTSITDQNLTEKEIKTRLNLGNACYHSVQKPFVLWSAL
jgi:hypothetical protein